MAIFARLVRRWRRRWWILLLGVLAGGFAGVLAARHVSPLYVSQTTMLVQRGSAAAGPLPINIENEAHLVTSTVVGNEAVHLLRSTTPEATLAGRVAVTVPSKTSILVIECTAITPESAQSCAAAFAQAYVDVRMRAAQTHEMNQLTSLTAQIKALTTQMQEVSNQIAALSASSPNFALAQIQKQVLTDQLHDLTNQQQGLDRALPNPAVTISAANLPAGRSNPANLVLYMLAGALAGLLVALAICAWPGPNTPRRKSAQVAVI